MPCFENGRPSRLVWGLTALAAVLLLVAPAEAGRTDYVDKQFGFQIRLPSRDWSQTPTQPGERIEVAKFKDDRQGDFSTLSIYRFVVRGGNAVTTPQADTEGEEATPLVPGPGRLGQPDNAKDHLAQTLARRYRRFGYEEAEIPEPKTADFGDIEGELYESQLEHTRRKGYWVSSLAGIVSDGREEYLIVYTCQRKLKKYLRAWKKSIRSFRFKSADTEIVEDDLEERDRGRDDEQELLDLEKRARIKDQLRGDWRFIDTPHYIVIFNCDDRLARYIAERIEYMRAYAFETVFPPVKPIEECMVVRVCKEMDEYHHYGGPRGSAGYWASGRDELVFPDLSRSRKPDETTIGVLHHEGFHQYVYYALLKHNPPVWFNEGFAEYFFCVNSTKEKLRFEKRHPMRYSTVKSALGMDTLIPVKDFIKLTHMQYMQRARLCYAQGWAFATWLKNVTKNERYQQIPDIFFRELQTGYQQQAAEGSIFAGFNRERGPVVENALEKAFEGIDLDELDAEFKKDLKRRM